MIRLTDLSSIISRIIKNNINYKVTYNLILIVDCNEFLCLCI